MEEGRGFGVLENRTYRDVTGIEVSHVTAMIDAMRRLAKCNTGQDGRQDALCSIQHQQTKITYKSRRLYVHKSTGTKQPKILCVHLFRSGLFVMKCSVSRALLTLSRQFFVVVATLSTMSLAAATAVYGGAGGVVMSDGDAVVRL